MRGYECGLGMTKQDSVGPWLAKKNRGTSYLFQPADPLRPALRNPQHAWSKCRMGQVAHITCIT